MSLNWRPRRIFIFDSFSENLWHACDIALTLRIVRWWDNYSVADCKGINSGLNSFAASIEDLRNMFGRGLSHFGYHVILRRLPKIENLARVVQKNGNSGRLAGLGWNASVVFTVNKHKLVKTLHHWGFTHKFYNSLNLLFVLCVLDEFIC